MDDPALWICLRDSPGLRPDQVAALLRKFGTPAAVYGSPTRELESEVGPTAARPIAEGPEALLPGARAELDRADALGHRALVWGDPQYPQLLAEIGDAPAVLYVRGAIPAGPRFSIVGSRRGTARGRETARAFAARIAGAGACVVSGLAYGVDSAAHRGALDAAGYTAAVLASGLDDPTPHGNRPLARRILAAGGALLSEHPPGTPVRPYHFPRRNRLISGLSAGTLIVEARAASGSLWTARHAREQSREVYAVPGPIDSDHCVGSNRLLRDGAITVLDEEDALTAAFRHEAAHPSLPWPKPALARQEAALLEALAAGPSEPDDLALALGAPPSALASLLLDLELRGLITREGSRISAGPAVRAGAPRP